MFMSEHKLMVFEGDGGRVASNYWSCLGLLCVRCALRLFEREKRAVTIAARVGAGCRRHSLSFAALALAAVQNRAMRCALHD